MLKKTANGLSYMLTLISCVPLTVQLLNQWSGADINEPSVNNDAQLKALTVINTFWETALKLILTSRASHSIMLTESREPVSNHYVPAQS